jgi:hypothetical protein
MVPDPADRAAARPVRQPPMWDISTRGPSPVSALRSSE